MKLFVAQKTDFEEEVKDSLFPNTIWGKWNVKLKHEDQ